jgi:hypothetical protein
MRPPFGRLFVLLAATILLNACSAIRVGYGNADSLARWWMDQYLDFTPEQDALVRERLTRLHLWHRQSQLPDYAVLLREARDLVDSQPTAANSLGLSESIIRRVRTLADKAIPDVADLLPTLTPAQIDRMAARLADKNADYAKEARLAEGEPGQRKARMKRLLERAEYWFGDFSGDQEAAIRRLIDAQPTGSQFWFDERLRRQREWLDLVRKVQRERPARDAVITLLRDYAERFDIPVEPTRRTQAIALRRSSAELAVAMHALTTKAQRDRARLKFDDLIRELGELAQEN